MAVRKTIRDLTEAERAVVVDLDRRIRHELPGLVLRMTVFGSRARGEAEPDSDMDVLVEVESEHLSFAEKQQLRRAAGELSIDSGIVLSLLVVDQRMRKERGDFSIFQNIRDEGIPV